MMAWERARGRSAKWFLAPALALLAVFVVWPLVRAGVWSFTNAGRWCRRIGTTVIFRLGASGYTSGRAERALRDTEGRT